MPTRFLSDAELARLSGFPTEIDDDDLVTFFRLEGEDLAWLGREHRGPANRLGLALQLCTLPWLGFVPDDLGSAPESAVERLAAQLGVDVGAISDYGGWKERTRTEHLREVLARLDWRSPGRGELKALDDFLLARALEHDSPTLLLGLACEYLRAERVVRPGPDRLSRRVATARTRAWTETTLRLSPLLTPTRRAELECLLEVDPALGVSQLVWLRRGATSATPEVIKVELAKLASLRAAGTEGLDLSMLPPGRWRHLALLGRRSTTQALSRMDPKRRHAVLFATVVETAVEVLDELVQLFDQALAGADSRARTALDERLLAAARANEDRDRLLDELLDVLLDPYVPDDAVGRRLREGVGVERLHAAHRPPEQRITRALGHLQLLEARYAYLRSFAPEVLGALPLAGGSGADSLLRAVEILRHLNTTGRRRVPDDAPADFVPTRWRSRLETARAEGERGAVHRHYWEVAVLYGLQAALRSGDVWVPGSRRYADPATYLIPTDRWAPLRAEFCQLTGTPADPDVRLAQLEADIHAGLSALEPILAGGNGIARLDDEGELVVAPLPAETPPPGTLTLRDAATERLPHVDLAALLIEVDAACGFTDHLTHAGGSSSRTGDLRRNLYAALLAQATNLGHAGMADAAGISEDALAWTSQWYLREETLRAANTALVNYHHRLPLARLWGGGTLSSSDGQRFPQRGKSTTARALSRYFLDEGTTTYTHVADQHATYGTKVIPSTVRDATYVLDEILGNPTDLPVAEHAVDTSGQSLAIFAAICSACASRPASGTCPAGVSTAWGQPRTWPPGATPVRCSPSPSRPGSSRPHGTSSCAWPAPSSSATPPPRCSSAGSKPEPARTPSPKPSSNTAAWYAPSSCSATWPIPSYAVGSTANSTKEKASTPSAGGSSSPSRATSGAATITSRPNRRSASRS
jgi:hypothetical protein